MQNRQTHPVTRSPVTWADLVQDLLWPRVFRAFTLALAPSRLGLAFFGVVLLLTVDRGWHWAFGGPAPGPISSAIAFIAGQAIAGVHALGRLDGPALGDAAYRLVMGGPAAALREHAAAMLVLLPLTVLCVAVVGGAICRSAACEFSLNVKIGWTDALGFALKRWRSMAAAVSGPLVTVWVISGVLVLGGWLMQIALVNIAGGLAFGLAIVAALGAACVMLGITLAHPLLLASVACEGTDAYDAVQRAYAYTLNRFGRLALYLGLLIAQGLVVATLLTAIVGVTLQLTARTTGMPVYQPATAPGVGAGVLERAVSAVAPVVFADPPGEPLPALRDEPLKGPTVVEDKAAPPGWSDRVTFSLVRFWAAIPVGLATAFMVAFGLSGSTIVYLLMRQVCDGQDAGELWMPGMVDGTLASLSDDGQSAAAPGGVDADDR